MTVEGSRTASFRVPALRWCVALLLMGVTVINYLDRTCLAFAAPTLKEQLAIDEAQFSRVLMAFQLTYLLMQPVSGRLIDWLGIRIGMAGAIAWWSAAQALTAVCGGVGGFAVVRSLLGVGEAANFPGASKAVSLWFPRRERSVATGVINVGSGIGQMIAAPIVAALILRWNWRVAFAATGAVGFLWLGLWLIAYRDPGQHPWLSSDEWTRIREGDEACDGARGSSADGRERQAIWTAVLGARRFWGLATARFFSEPAWQFFTYWIPLYLATERHLQLKEIAVFAWLPFLAGDLGSLVGGALGPLFMRAGAPVIRARKLSALTCAVLMVFAVFIGSAPNAAWAVFFFCVGAFAHQAMSATLLTLPADLFPGRMVATANGLSGMAGGIGGLLFTGIIGVAVHRAGYAPLFVAIALFDLVGSTVLWATLREPRREDA
jgi:ACS family hexuronate transporter-like MFS transporter